MAQRKLLDWRDRIFARDHANAQFDAEGLLPDTLIEILVSLRTDYITSTALPQLLQSEWTFWEQYSDELVGFVRDLNIMYTPVKKNLSIAAQIILGDVDDASSYAPASNLSGPSPSVSQPSHSPESQTRVLDMRKRKAISLPSRPTKHTRLEYGREDPAYRPANSAVPPALDAVSDSP